MTTKYFSFEIAKKVFKTETLKLEALLTYSITQMKKDGVGIDKLDAIKTLNIFNAYCKKHNITPLVLDHIKGNNSYIEYSQLLEKKKEDLFFNEYKENYENLFEDTVEISEEDFQELKNLLDNIINMINGCDIEKTLKDEIINAVKNIINNLKKDINEMDKSKGQIISLTDRLHFLNIPLDIKNKAIDMLVTIFNKCREVTIQVMPEVKELKFNLDAKLSIEFKGKNKSSIQEDDIIDTETIETE